MAEKSKVPPQSLGDIYNLPIPPPKKSSDYIGPAYSTWVYSAVNLIARAVAGIDLRLYERKKKGKEWVIEEVTEHEVLSLLHEVNPFYTRYQLIDITSIYLGLSGEAYWALIRVPEKTGKPAQIWPLRPDWVSVVADKKEFIKEYKYGPIQGGEVTFRREDIIPFKEFDPTNPHRGKGAVQAGSMIIDIDTFSDEMNRNFFYNSALPYIVFMSEESPTEEQKKRFLQDIQNRFGGRRNAHKVMALWGKGWKVDKFGESMKELDFINSKQYLRDEILAQWHVSKANIGLVEDVNRANLEASNIRLMRDVIKPKMTRFVAHLNEFLLPNWEDEDLFLDFENPVPEDTELKLKMYESGLTNGWLTINEVRELENRPPAKGGDVIFLPFNLQPVGSVGEKIRGFFGKSKEKEEGVITLPVKEKKKRVFTMPIPPRKLAALRKDLTEKKIEHDLFRLANLLVREKHKKKEKTEESRMSLIPPEMHESFWKQMVAKTDVYEDKMKEMLRRVFDDQETEVISRLEAKRDFLGRTKALNVFPPMAEEIKRWLGVFSPFIREVVIDKGREIFGLLGVGGPELDLSTSRATRFLMTDGLVFVKQCNETTRDKLRKSLAEGLEKKESIPQLKKRIEAIFVEARGRRAELIARTEVLSASNFATVEAYMQSDVVKGKQWLVAYDERTCEHCIAMEGQVVDKNKNFVSNTLGIEVWKPPLHPGCRCTETPTL